MNFFRGWEAYRDGFGKLTGEHWLGETPARRLARPLLCNACCQARAPSSQGCQPGLRGLLTPRSAPRFCIERGPERPVERAVGAGSPGRCVRRGWVP